MVSNQDRNDVLAEIRRAFPAGRDKPETFFPPQSADGVSEYWQVRKFLEQKDWDVITKDQLQADYRGDEQAMLAFLSPEGFRYYLPAFLTIGMDAIRDHPPFVDSTIFYLTPSDQKGQKEMDIERYSSFTAAQKSAIRSWLRYVDRHKSVARAYVLRPDVALARYWERV